MVLSLAALTIGILISYVLIEALLNMLYPDAIPISLRSRTIQVVLIMVILTVVITQVRKVATSNLVEGLRVE